MCFIPKKKKICPNLSTPALSELLEGILNDLPVLHDLLSKLPLVFLWKITDQNLIYKSLIKCVLHL